MVHFVKQFPRALEFGVQRVNLASGIVNLTSRYPSPFFGKPPRMKAFRGPADRLSSCSTLTTYLGVAVSLIARILLHDLRW